MPNAYELTERCLNKITMEGDEKTQVFAIVSEAIAAERKRAIQVVLGFGVPTVATKELARRIAAGD